eukprot:NODE_329_length_9526_cov_0.701708.p10 type:complete len:114 gc:universal NODE_329_length_9526_cov_0.701708:2373-2032(-)
MDLNDILDDASVLISPVDAKSLISGGICPVCNRRFCDSSTALRHLKHVHANPVPCKYCLKPLKYIGRPAVIKNHYIRCSKFAVDRQDNLLQCAAEEAKKDYDKVKIGYKSLLS